MSYGDPTIPRPARAAELFTREMIQRAEYLADAVYLTDDGYRVWIFTYNGAHVGEAIAIEHETWALARAAIQRRLDALTDKEAE